MKKSIKYFIGAVLAYLYDPIGILAQSNLGMVTYGPPESFEATRESTWDKIVSIVLSPAVIMIIFSSTLAVGVVLFFIKKRKNNKKNIEGGETKTLDHS